MPAGITSAQRGAGKSSLAVARRRSPASDNPDSLVRRVVCSAHQSAGTTASDESPRNGEPKTLQIKFARRGPQ